MAQTNLIDLLVAQGAISEADARAAFDQHRNTGKPLAQAILDVTLLDDVTLAKAQSKALNIPRIQLAGRKLHAAALAKVDEAFCHKYRCLPFDYHEAGRFLDVAMADPTDATAYDQLRVCSKCNIRPHVVELSVLDQAIRWAFGQSAARQLAPLPMAPAPGQSLASGQPTDPGTAPQYSGGYEYDLSEEGSMDAAVGARDLAASPDRGGSRVTALQSQVGQLANQMQSIGRLLEQLTGQVAAMQRQRSPDQAPPTLPPDVHEDGDDIYIDTLGGTPVVTTPAAASDQGLTHVSPTLEVPLTDLAKQHIAVIDFGTSRSSIAAAVSGKAQPLPLPGDQWDMPSMISFREDGSAIVGQAAKEAIRSHPTRTIASPKRLLGRQHDDPGMAPYLAQLQVATTAAANGEILLNLDDRQLSIPEVCSEVLRALRKVGERTLRQPVEEAVVMIPSAFDDRQRTALRMATKMAGLAKVHLLEEPVAAALSNYRDPDFGGLVVVYDFGGGTFDFAVLEHSATQTQVIGTGGDTWLGGDDIDLALAAAVADDFWAKQQVQLRHQAVQWQRLLQAAEAAKIELSNQQASVIDVGQVAHTSAGMLNVHFPVQRPLLARQIKPLVQRSFEACNDVLDAHDIKKRDIRAVYLSGGSCWIPAIQATVAQFFGKKPKSMVRPERAVLLGGVIHAVSHSRAAR